MRRNHYVLLFLAIGVLLVTRGGEFVCSHEILAPGDVVHVFLMRGGMEVPLTGSQVTEVLSLYNLGEDPLLSEESPGTPQVVMDLKGGATMRIWRSTMEDRVGIQTASLGKVKIYTLHAPKLKEYLHGCFPEASKGP